MSGDGEPNSDGHLQIIQLTEVPVFRGSAADPDAKLLCASNCGQVLIENYLPDDFVSIDIRCFKCGSFTSTPPMADGEVFPLRTFARDGQMRLSQTVATQGVAITSETESRRVRELTRPSSNETSWLNPLSIGGLEELVRRYEEIVPGVYTKQQKIIERVGAQAAKKLPFAWSVSYFKK